MSSGQCYRLPAAGVHQHLQGLFYRFILSLPPIGSSDHNVVIVHALASMCSNLSNCVSFNVVHSNDQTGKTLLAHELSRFNWAPLYRMNDCNDMLNLFYDTVVKSP